MRAAATSRGAFVTRSEQIVRAIVEELRRRAREIDSDLDIRAVTVSVKLAAEQGQPRAVVCQIESERRFPPGGRRP